MKYSLLFRFWHWLNAIVIIGLVATVLLRWTLLAKHTTADLLADKLSLMDIFITHDQAIILVKALRVGLWEWHIILGFTFAALTLLRLYLHFTDSKTRVAFKDLNLHKKIVRILYCALYAVFALMAVSGLGLYFSDDLGLQKDIISSIKNLHESLYYYVAFFIVVHVVGVFVADATEENGLISTMVHGKEIEKEN